MCEAGAGGAFGAKWAGGSWLVDIGGEGPAEANPGGAASGGGGRHEANAPDRINSGVGTLADLGAMAGMPSLPSLSRFIAAQPGFPILSRGKSGKAYQFDLGKAAAFVLAHWRDGRSEPSGRMRRKRKPAPQSEPPQFFLPLIGHE